MIDTHCHLLPALDDGPGSPEEAIELARALTADGIAGVLCTPHYSRRFPTSHDEAAERLRELAPELERLGLETRLAAEVSPGRAVSASLDELRERSIAGRYVVVEALRDTPAGFFELVVARLEEASLLPVVAHPERCPALRSRLRLADWIRRRGGVLQVLAPSLIGRFGAEVGAAAWRLVDTGRASLVASDAHGVRRRTVHLGEAAELVRRRLGASLATELTESRPARLLAGEPPE